MANNLVLLISIGFKLNSSLKPQTWKGKLVITGT